MTSKGRENGMLITFLTFFPFLALHIKIIILIYLQADDEQSFRDTIAQGLKSLQEELKRSQDNEDKLFGLLAELVQLKKQRLN
jgi:hypothetical protein